MAPDLWCLKVIIETDFLCTAHISDMNLKLPNVKIAQILKVVNALHIVKPLRVLAFAVALELLPGQVWAAEGL